MKEEKCSFTIGTGTTGAIKIYWDIDEDYKVLCKKMAKARVLHELFCANPPDIDKLFEISGVKK